MVAVCHAQQSASSTPAGPVAFRPGVSIDWAGRSIHVQTRVALRAGALEFFACWPGKEHESILRIEAAATDVFMALGLIGIWPGHPPAWDSDHDSYAAPAGDLLDLVLRWEQDGGTHSADACDWLLGVEYGRTPLPRPWIFAGSLRQPDGGLASDVSGVGVALVDFPDSFLCYSRRCSSRTEELWAAARTPTIPPTGTPVLLILRPAIARAHRIVVDFRGVVRVDDRYCPLAELADLLALNQRLSPAEIQPISLHATLRGDELRLEEALLAAGVPRPSWCFRRTALRSAP